MFEGLREVIHARVGVEQAGYIVSDSWAYLNWTQARPDFEQAGHLILKEWEVTRRPACKPDLAKLAQFETRLGAEAGLFGAIVADRRLFMGMDCTYSQDYRRRFDDLTLLWFLQHGLEEIESLFDRLRPDVYVSFICVTFLDYLTYLMAKARGVRVMNLRPTRIGDRVILSDTLNDPDPRFVATYQRILTSGESSELGAARTYIRRVRERHGLYEGVVRPSDKPALKINPGRQSLWSGIVRILGNYVRYRRSVAARDNHVADPLRALFFASVVNPWRARRTRTALARHYVSDDYLSEERFAFFPLHTEPEVSLLVYGRPFVNQIEVIRMLAMSLPAEMYLVIKEHPWMVGKRTAGFYLKLLNIPKVRLANPAMDARELIKKAQLVCVITGSVALEAAMLGKPVLTFGDCPYNALPSNRVRRCEDPRQLPAAIRALLVTKVSDDQALEAYVAAVFSMSVSVQLYSVLLAKKSVHRERDSTYDEELGRLAQYLIDCLQWQQVELLSLPAARW